MRQDASELVRRVEGGAEIDISVSGRLAARLVPATPNSGSGSARLYTRNPGDLAGIEHLVDIVSV